MLLIAITGDKGSGKSTLLAQLADWYRAEHRRVDGFVSEAGDRPDPRQGAQSYALRWVASGDRSLFARRIEVENGIPYVLEEATLARTRAWAASLAAASAHAPELVVLDEFGLLESEGQGHMQLWPDLVAAHAPVVAMTVRTGALDAVSARLGRPFDLVVASDDPAAWETLRAACLAHRDWTRVGLHGAASGALEMTLGAALHGGMVPFRGLTMASAQAAVMTWAASGLGTRSRVVWVPFIAAGLKALSPAGNRLRPMLAITIQGLLFAGTTRLLGWHRASVAVASALVGAWAASQGLIMQYLFVGKELLRAYTWVVDQAERWVGISPPAVATAIAAWIGLWALVAGTVGALTFGRTRRTATTDTHVQRRLDDWRARWGSAMPSLSREPGRPTWAQAIGAGARDLTRPTFWVPLLLIVAIILAAGSPWESAFWVVARAATIGMLLFTAVRFLDVQGAVRALRRRGHWGPAIALSRAIETLSAPAGKGSP
jgi:nucleoside-triphosphatase THEP1